MVLALDLHGNGQPLHALRCFDLVTIAPIPPGGLHVIVEDKFIHGSDHVKIAFPWDVVGLDDGDLFHNAVDTDDESNKKLFIYNHHGLEVC